VGSEMCIRDRYDVAVNGKKNANGMNVHVPRILEEECVGCNLCALVCPVEDCITMREVDTGKPPISWNQRMGGQATSCAPPMPSVD